MNLNGKIKKTQALSGRLVKSSGGGGSVQEIYWVQYGVGTATNAEVNEAVAANKLPICYFDSTNAYGRATRTLYFLVRHTPTEAFFATVLPTTQIIEVKRLYADAFNTEIIRYEGKLTWDTTPRFGSANPVTSGGIYNAIQNATVSDERIAEAVDDWLSVQAPSIGTLSYAAKQALLACFRHVAWIDDQGQSYYNALESELFPDATLESISAVFTQGSAVIYDTDSLDTLRQYLVVTANFSDSTTATVTDYTLSGTLTAGTSTIMVSYGGKTTTFNVNVTSWDINWDYTMGAPSVAGLTVELDNYGSSATMESDGLHVLSKGSVIIARATNFTANHGVAEFDLTFTDIPNGYQGFFIGMSDGTHGARMRIYSNKITLGYSATNDEAHTETIYSGVSVNTPYVIRFEWDISNGFILSINGETVYTLNHTLDSTLARLVMTAIGGGAMGIDAYTLRAYRAKELS